MWDRSRSGERDAVSITSGGGGAQNAKGLSEAIDNA